MKEVVGQAAFEGEVLNSPGAVIVVFEAHWCPFCRSFMPIIRAHEAQLPAPLVASILDDWDDPLWERYSVEVVPTLAIFRGGRLAFRIDGILGKGLAEEDVKRLIADFRNVAARAV